MVCGCIDIGTNTTRVLVADARDGAPDARSSSGARSRAWAAAWRPAARFRRARIAENAGVVAEQRRARRAGRRATDPHRRHGGDPRRRQPRRVLSTPMREHGGVEVCVLDGRGGGAAGVPRGDADARAAARRTRRRWSTSAAARPRSRSARSTAASTGGRRSRSAPASSPTRTWAATRRRARELDAVRAHAAQVLAGIDAAAGRRRGRGRRQRGLAAAARRRRARATRASQRALRVLTSGPAADVAARFALDPQRVRLMPAGLLALDAAGAGARPAAADRRAAACARACCSTWRDVTSRSRIRHRTAMMRDVTDVTSPPEPPPRPISRIRALYFNRELSWLEFNDARARARRGPARPAAGAA